MSRTAAAAVARRPRAGAPVPNGRIGILAGGGRLPLMIAESVVAHGGAVHIVGIEGEADAAIAGFPHTWVNWGQIGRMVAVLRSEGGGRMVIAGGVRRPDLWKLRPDWGFFLCVAQILAMMRGGDDSVLSRVVRFFEAKGLKVLGAHEVAPDLLVHGGQLGAAALSGQGRADAELGFAVRGALGPLDAGQAVAVADGKVLAIEGAEGTDAMLRRVAEMRSRGENKVGRSGVLAKGPKSGQELRVDMPAVGPRTVELAADAGLAGVAVEAGAVLLLDRGETIRAADALGLAIEGLRSPPPKHRSDSPPPCREGLGVGGTPNLEVRESPPPCPSPARGEGTLWPSPRSTSAVERPLWIVGRLHPNARANGDVGKALAAVECLSPFGAGQAVVVARAYLLAIAAADSALAVLERTRALRQWGVGAKRRVGVLACRARPSEWDATQVALLLDRAAAAGLAGVAVTGVPGTLAAFERAGGLADRHGLFLVTRGERP
jgi:UDP-2,3-diacylglucosamine hydrolase